MDTFKVKVYKTVELFTEVIIEAKNKDAAIDYGYDNAEHWTDWSPTGRNEEIIDVKATLT